METFFNNSFDLCHVSMLLGVHGRYVDVLGGTSSKLAVGPAELFNVLPNTSSVSANLFVPAG